MNQDAEDRKWNYDDKAARYDEIVAGDHPMYDRYDEVLDAVAELAGVAPGKRVLDIGAGTGALARRCANRGAEAVGLDPSEGMLARAREKLTGQAGVEFRQVAQPFLQIPFPDESFDAVVSTYAFHHVPPEQKAAAMAEMHRVLKPGGLWALGDLIFEDEQAERAALDQYCWLEDEYFARIDELRPLVAKLGLELHTRQFTPVTWVVWARKD